MTIAVAKKEECEMSNSKTTFNRALMSYVISDGISDMQ